MEQKHPKISLLIFTYNRAHLVEKAINSVLNQTYRDFELVLVNNGSTDNTREVLEKYANHKNARVIHVEKNLGSNGGFNFALDQIRGEWWGQMGDDDRLYEYALETMMNVLDEVDPTISAISANCISTATGEFTASGFEKDQYVSLEKMIVQANGEFFGISKTELLGDKRFNPELPGDDNVVWYQIDALAKRYYIHKPLMVYNDIPGDTEYHVHSKVNPNIRIKRYTELLKEDFYWNAIRRYNIKQYRARCLRGIYFMKIAGDQKRLAKYRHMLKHGQSSFKHKLCVRIIRLMPPGILKKLYELSGKSSLTQAVFRFFFKRHTHIGQKPQPA